MVGLEVALRDRTRLSPRPSRRDVADRRAGVRGALLAASHRQDRTNADPRPRTRDLIESAINQILDSAGPAGTTTFSWDGNGNQATKAEPGGTTEYTWDARDRLAEIALPAGRTARYGYDTENLRVSMDDADGPRRILLDGLEEVGEYDDATGEIRIVERPVEGRGA